MPASNSGTESAPPSVPLSFSNNFWGRDDAGVDPLLSRMQNAKTTCDELKAFYHARAELEEDYARKLFQMARKPLGSTEMGTLRASLDVARGETEAMGKAHQLISQQMKRELEEPLQVFAGGLKERRKIHQTTIERLLKTKQAQTAQVNKFRDKYEQDCLRIKGCLAQGHMVMGQEERKNKAKLEKAQINMAANSTEYETAIKVVEETIGRWNKEWKSACDKFQDLEEERIDWTKNSLWEFANIASTVCVSDDTSCENVRQSLEKCEVQKDISEFIKSYGTGQEIPDPPRFINFCRGDLDSASEVSEDDNYSVAQFSRNTNPVYRSSSPNPAATSSDHVDHHDFAEDHTLPDENDMETPMKANSGRPAPLNFRQQGPNVPPNYSPSQHGDVPQVPHNEYPTEGMTMYCRAGPPSMNGSNISANTRPQSRDSESEYSAPSSFTSADPMSGKNSPVKGHQPINGVGMPGMVSGSPEKSIQKKRSGFFSNSPFRRKSKKELENPRSQWNNQPVTTPLNEPTTTPFNNKVTLNSSNISSSSAQSSPTKPSPRGGQNLFNRNAASMAPEGEEPADPRATFQLNIGNNVLDVANPDDIQSTPRANRAANTRRAPYGNSNVPSSGGDFSMDPIAQALADLKSSSGSTMSKPASMRQPVDRYHGVKTPAPDSAIAARPSTQEREQLHGLGRTPPPSYDYMGGSPTKQIGGGGSALGVPEPAFTSREMRSRTETWGAGSAVPAQPRGQPMPRPASRDGRRSPGPGMMPRATSPRPDPHYAQRARSPGPGMMPRATSPRPGHQFDQRARSPGPNMMRARSPGPGMMGPGPGTSPQHQGQYMPRAASPNPYPQSNGQPRPRQGPPLRQGSGMEMQLASSDVQQYGGSGRSRQGMANPTQRPGSAYGSSHGSQQGGYGNRSELRRERSKSMAAMPQVMHYARAIYSYTAAIPEELSFSKGDILAVIRLQDDGWWEAEIKESSKGMSGLGLVPSNYLQRC